MSDKTDLTAIINILHFGNSEIEFQPISDINEIKLMKLAFLYAVKVRFLLETEPLELRKMYEDLFNVILHLRRLNKSITMTMNFADEIADFF